MTGCLPGLVTVDKGLVSWACCCPLWVGLYFYTGLAIIHVYIQSLRGCLFPSCLPARSLETSAWTNVHGSCGVTLPQALSVPKCWDPCLPSGLQAQGWQGTPLLPASGHCAVQDSRAGAPREDESLETAAAGLRRLALSGGLWMRPGIPGCRRCMVLGVRTYPPVSRLNITCASLCAWGQTN